MSLRHAAAVDRLYWIAWLLVAGDTAWTHAKDILASRTIRCVDKDKLARRKGRNEAYGLELYTRANDDDVHRIRTT